MNAQITEAAKTAAAAKATTIREELNAAHDGRVGITITNTYSTILDINVTYSTANGALILSKAFDATAPIETILADVNDTIANRI